MRISDWSSDVCSSDLASEIRKLLPLRVGLNEYPAEPEPSQPGIFVARNLPPNVYQIRVDPLPTASVKSDRKRVVQGKSVSVRVDIVGRRVLKKQLIHIC